LEIFIALPINTEHQHLDRSPGRRFCLQPEATVHDQNQNQNLHSQLSTLGRFRLSGKFKILRRSVFALRSTALTAFILGRSHQRDAANPDLVNDLDPTNHIYFELRRRTRPKTSADTARAQHFKVFCYYYRRHPRRTRPCTPDRGSLISHRRMTLAKAPKIASQVCGEPRYYLLF